MGLLWSRREGWTMKREVAPAESRRSHGVDLNMTPSNPNFPNLVSCDKAHYILSIKRGVLLKLPNVDFRGRPELKFKDLASIYRKMLTSSQKSTDDDVAGSEMTLKEIRIKCQKQKSFVADVELDEPLILFKKRKPTDPDPVRKRKKNKNQQNLERESEDEPPSTSCSQVIEAKKKTIDVDVSDPSYMIDGTFACSVNEIYTIDNFEASSPDEMESSSHDDAISHDEIDMVVKSTPDSTCGQPLEENPAFEIEDPCSTPTELTNAFDEVDFSKEVNYHVEEPGNEAQFLTSEESQPLTLTVDVDQVNILSPEVPFQEDEAQHQSKHPPIKLLSNRKVLSPTTQEKLCQEVDSYKPVKPPRKVKKLCFEQNFTDSPPKNSPVLEFCEKSNNSAVGPTKGILKTVNVPRRKHMQEAVIFSQRQMHDIESLATKLVNGLRSMKGVMEETLTSEESSSPLRVNADKMRAAIDDAAELEETAKKWLFMMGKDCNRFCKILQRTALQRTSSEIRNDQKKITFADEAGGMLCQVKIFQEPSS